MKSKPVLRSRDMTRRGMSREGIRRLVNKGEIEHASRGVYFSPVASRSQHRDLLIVAARVPNAVFCLLTALAFHGMTDEMPNEVWIAIGLKSRTPAIDTPPVRVVRLSDAPLNSGVVNRIEQGTRLRVFSPAKTVADCFKFRNKIGIDVAIAALRNGWEMRRFTMDEVWHFAGVCRVATVMRPYLEAIVS